MIIYIGRDGLHEHGCILCAQSSPSERRRKHVKITNLKAHAKASRRAWEGVRAGKKKVKLSLLELFPLIAGVGDRLIKTPDEPPAP